MHNQSCEYFWSLLSFKTRHIIATAQSEITAEERKGEEEDQNKKERGIDYKLISFCAFYANAPALYGRGDKSSTPLRKI